MLLEIIRFELKYRFKRPATYLYFAILFLLTLAVMTTDGVQIGGAVGQVKINAPVTITNVILIITTIFTMIVSAIMGVGVLRDFEHKTHSMLFTTPITKRDYLFGRFIGSFIVLLFVFSGAFFGMTLGYLKSFSEPERFLAFNLWHYLQPFLLFGVTNLFISGTIMFAGGALSRKMLVVYTQGILLLVFYMIALTLSSSLEYKNLVAWVDPFGISAFKTQVKYWSIIEKNTQTAQLTGIVLYNRLLWVSIAFVSLFILYKGFAFRVVRQSLFKPKPEIKTVSTPIALTNLPKANLHFGFGATIQHVFKLSIFYFKSLFKEIPFLTIVLAGMIMTIVGSLNMNESYGTFSFPTTYSVIELIQTFTLFFLIIVIFYTGELVWKEREAKMDSIIDALPTQTWISIISKFFGLILSYSVLIVMLIFTGVLIQTFKGYYNYELGLYFKVMFTETLSMLIIYTLLGLFVHVIINNKFIGFATMIVIFILELFVGYIGIEHPLFHLGSGMSLGRYSDMNTFGHFVTPFSWMSAYWIMFSVVLLFFAIYFSVRGTETNLRTRFEIGKYRINKTWIIGLIISGVAIIFLGSFIFYNINILNEYKNSKQGEKLQVSYEKNIKQYKDIILPKITAANLKVDIFPSERNVVAEGYFTLKNKTDKPISDIHIQKTDDGNIKTEYIKFSREANLKKEFEEFNYVIYTLVKPLQPNETINLNFKIVFETKGFVVSGSNTSIIENGTFFNNLSLFPSLGYNASYELSSYTKRKEYDLPERERMPKREDKKFHTANLFGDDADRIDFEIILSTSPDQIAIAPGYLQKEWMENDRRYFHYKMDVPMVNFYAIQSGRYEVMKDSWKAKADSNGNQKEVSLEIYYHKTHTANLDKMMNAMKDALSYYSENFSEYQYSQLRIIEFPRYQSFAQSFANTVPFSEQIGFMLDVKQNDVDLGYKVTAHETAHQWWGHQVTEAPVQGSAMLSETLSQYSALMVMKHKYPQEMLQKFLSFELDRYLRERSSEREKELPLDLLERQNYIAYGKGALVMFALQDYIGEDKINLALRNYLNKWKFSEGIYPTTTDLTNEIKAVTPDSLQYLITDWVENITFYENKTEKVTYKDLGNDMYEVTLELSSKKTVADSLGTETDLPLKEWIDIGVYGEEPKEANAEGYKFAPFLYLEKHQITKEKTTIKVKVKGKPIKAGIDPLNKLIDKHPNDNVIKVEEN